MAGATTDVVGTETAMRSPLGAMDAAAEYVRRRWHRVLPCYAVGAAGFSVGIMMVFDVVTSQQRGLAMVEACLVLTAMTLWRWGWTAAAQKRMQEDFTGRAMRRVRANLPAILLLRLYAFFCMSWGAILIVPALYGLFLSGFAGPLALDRDEPVWPRTKTTLAWINRSAGRLGRVAMTMLMLLFLLLVGYAATHLLMLGMILPSLLGMNVSELSITMNSMAWFLFAAYLGFLVYDFYWMMLSVVLFYTIESAREGVDLRIRLTRVKEAVG